GSGGEPRAVPVVGRYDLCRGEKVVSITPGGGGYGDPLERDPQAVLVDVNDGRVSARAAWEVYGVRIDEHGTIDSSATEKQRRNLSQGSGSVPQ
ncbi:hypothetical protein R0K30_21500, partial [Bacillus sp. SIMBA_154]